MAADCVHANSACCAGHNMTKYHSTTQCDARNPETTHVLQVSIAQCCHTASASAAQLLHQLFNFCISCSASASAAMSCLSTPIVLFNQLYATVLQLLAAEFDAVVRERLQVSSSYSVQWRRPMYSPRIRVLKCTDRELGVLGKGSFGVVE